MEPERPLVDGQIEAGPCSLGQKCRAQDKRRLVRYKCRICREGLHPMFCSLVIAENVIECPEGLGCKDKKPSARRSSPGRLSQQRSPQVELQHSPWRNSSKPAESRTRPAVASLPRQLNLQGTTAKSPPKKKRQQQKKGLKRGPKQGRKNQARSLQFWYDLCSKYVGTYEPQKMKQRSFLKSSCSGNEVSGTDSECVSFSSYLKKYRKGELKPSQKLRQTQSKYHEIEEKLVEYIQLRQQKYKVDKCGISWLLLQQKCLQWRETMEDEKYDNFQASPGWISKCLKRHNIVGLNLHGEAGEIDEEERQDDEDPVGVAIGAESDNSPSIPSFFEAEAMVNQLQAYAESQGMLNDDRRLLERFGQAMRSQRLLTNFFARDSSN